MHPASRGTVAASIRQSAAARLSSEDDIVAKAMNVIEQATGMDIDGDGNVGSVGLRRTLRIKRLSQAQLHVSQDTLIPERFKLLLQWEPLQPLLQLISVVVFFAVGVLFYSQVERYDFVTCVYFIMVTISTVGYGDLTPTTDGSRVFTVLYLIVGIPLIFTQVMALVLRLTRPCYLALRGCLERCFPVQGFDIDGNGKADYYVPPHPILFFASRLLGPVLTLAIVQVGFSIGFVQIEGWTFGKALYHCFVTATTCGYGETSITTNDSRLLAFFHITISVCVLAGLFGELDAMREDRKAQLHRQQLVMAKMDSEVWETIIPHGEVEINKFDFVYGMLVKLELVQAADIDVFTKVFERYQSAHGHMHRNQIAAIASGYHSRASMVGASRKTSGLLAKMGRTRSVPNAADMERRSSEATDRSTSGASLTGREVRITRMITEESSMDNVESAQA